jgi:hypothetical protein
VELRRLVEILHKHQARRAAVNRTQDVALTIAPTPQIQAVKG